MKKIARVFPSKTNATPDDDLVFFSWQPPLLAMPDIDEVHVSCAFTWDLWKAEQMAEAWRATGVPVSLGGPALNLPGGDFIPGMYLKPGYVITSRGCDRGCWFCKVTEREGPVVRELPITEGWILLDDNFLGCSEAHIRAVFEMMKKQPKRPQFKGGLEPSFFKPWHAELLREVRVKRAYFAYDTPDDYEPLVEAGKMLAEQGYSLKDHTMGCYCLIGYPGDTIEEAENRLIQTARAGFFPFAMLYRSDNIEEKQSKAWKQFQRVWVRPMFVAAMLKERQLV